MTFYISYKRNVGSSISQSSSGRERAREQLETAEEADGAFFSQQVSRFQIQEKLVFPLEPETRKLVMSQLQGGWAGVTVSCLWRVSLWFYRMRTVHIREFISQFPITITNA